MWSRASSPRQFPVATRLVRVYNCRMRIPRSLPVLGFLALAITLATPANAQQSIYGISWNLPAAPATGGETHATFDCAGGDVTHRLYLTITPTETITDLRAIDCVFDMLIDQPIGGPDPRRALPPFWHFEEGGCNAGGLVIQVPTASATNRFTNVFPSNANQLSWLYAPDYGGIGRGRVAVSLFHSQGLGVNLVSGRTYIVCEFDFSMCAGGICGGCGEPFCMHPYYVLLEHEVDSAYSQAGPFSSVLVNGGCFHRLVASGEAPPDRALVPKVAGLSPQQFGARFGPEFHAVPSGILACDVVPVTRRSWGTLKMLYH